MKYRKLRVYQISFEQAMAIFLISRNFPKEETYSLTDQIRRSSRAVSSNIAEAYRKRRYLKHFIAKLTDADAENSETSVWLDFAFACDYLSLEQKLELQQKNSETGRLLGYMIKNPEKFL